MSDALPQSAPPPPTSRRPAAIAIWSLVLGIASFLCLGGFFSAIPAIICGHIGRSNIRKSGGTLAGYGMATVGLGLGYLALAVNLILMSVLAISLINGDRERARRQTASTIEIAGTDGKIRISAPGDWRELPGLNDAAKLQAGNKEDKEFLIVLVDNKSDFVDLTLQKCHDKTRNANLDRLKDSSAGEVTELTINGHPALHDEIRGTSKDTNIVFLHTTVEDADHFYQILAWTLKSKWPEKKEKLAKVTSSFRSD